MSLEVFKVIDPGLGATVQDQGRRGWQRFGIPPSGVLDDHAAGWANKLLENPAGAPVLELLLQSARLSVLRDCWIAVTGADTESNISPWRAVRVEQGTSIEFRHNRSGVWIYLAVEGGFEADSLFGSASALPRAQLGKILATGDILQRRDVRSFQFKTGVGGVSAAWSERRTYDSPPPIRVYAGPQWDLIAESARQNFFEQSWKVGPQSDRVGYRLVGTPLPAGTAHIISEPVRPGTIQLPDNGLPIVTMRDGPTVGGYPKLGWVHPADLSWLAQSRPGQTIRFQLVT